MSNILRIFGACLVRPIIKLKATCRRNAIIIAHMTPEQLRDLQRQRRELFDAKERRINLLLRNRPPGGTF